MKKEYMLQRIEKYCNSHDIQLYISDETGAIVLLYPRLEIEDRSKDKFFKSITQLYKYLFN